MRYMNINRLQSGMHLGKDIEGKSASGQTIVLAKKDMVLTDSIISTLAKKGFEGVYIKDSLTEDINVEETISLSVQQDALKAIRKKDVEALIEQAKKIAMEIYENKLLNVDLVRMLHSSDIENHSLNVCELALVLAKVDKSFAYNSLPDLASVALLHDIGKILTRTDLGNITIPEEIIAKGDKTKSLDYFLHPVYGFYYLKRFHNISAVTNKSILLHHECPNGLGFPMGLKENDIPEMAKIINICDRYEHYLMLYGNPIDARNKIACDYTEGKVDMRLADLFLKYIPIFPLTTTVELSTGDIAVIVGYNDGFPERPIIRIVGGDGKDISLLDSNYLNVTVSKLFFGEQEVLFNSEEARTMR